MDDLNIISANGLIEATIKVKQETYYLVTEDNMNSLKAKSLLSDLFILLASLAWGAYVSVIITIEATFLDLNPEKQSNEFLQPLLTLNSVFLVAGILFTTLAIWMFYIHFSYVDELKKGKLEI